MILLLDAGNSRIKWGVRQAGTWLVRGVCATSEAASLADQLATYPLRRALLCCVADMSSRATLEALVTARVEEFFWLTPGVADHGVRSAYQPPESLGPDRYAALVAASRLGLGDCVVVSVGTALTVDALAAGGDFLGGVIAPGPELMRAALSLGTAGVRELAGDTQEFPVSTGAAVSGGVSLALSGVVNGMRQRLARLCGKSVTVVLSGGARALLDNLLESPVLAVDDLVLNGLAWIAKDRAWDD